MVKFEIRRPIFDLSTTELIRLSNEKVPEDVIAAMRNPQAVSRSGRSSSVGTQNGVKLPDGEKLRLMLAEDISSASANVGDRITFTVAEDFKVGDAVLISKGAQAVGSITEAKKKGIGCAAVSMSQPQEPNLAL